MNNFYMPSSGLKKYAREQLSGKLGTVIGAFLLHMMCVFPFTYIISFINTNTITKVLIYLIASIVVEMYATVYVYGEDLLYLNATSGGECRIMDIFSGFKGDTLTKIFKVRMIPIIVSKIAFIPYMFMADRVINVMPELIPSNQELLIIMQNNDIEAMDKIMNELMPLYMEIIVVSLIYLIVTLVVDVLFCQVLYIMLDYPELSAGEIISRNFAIMKGSYGRYIYVRLSFIPWAILASMTCGLTLLWSRPYEWATRTNFYLDLARKNKDFGGL